MTVPTLDPTAAAEYFFAGARDAGLAHVVLSPGSRSTPLTIAAARTPGISTSIELDERVAAFVALGMAKLSGRPVGLVCTSGTAAANYLPAVAEASMSNVPLVVITADRPPEHQDWGVGQSFDQRGLYQRHVRDELTMPVGGDAGPAFSQRAGWRATATALEMHGPVHVNWAFRMPLEPVAGPIDQPPTLSGITVGHRNASRDHVETFEAALRASRHPLILAGPDACPRHVGGAHEVLAFARAHDIPIVADILSGLPCDDDGPVVSGHALLTHAPALPSPDLIIHLGQTPTAKMLRLWWEKLDATHLAVDPYDEWQDPSHLVSIRLRCTPNSLLAMSTATPAGDASWMATWQALGQRVAERTAAVLDGWPTLTEGHVARTLAAHATSNDRIVASSSMPVRDLDTFAAKPAATIVANRGINGIDGVVSTAIGLHVAGDGGRTYVLIGDIASLHDVGGILSAARNGHDLTIVIPNNDGGGIFSFLPVKDAIDPDQFAALFHTPHGTTFEFLSGHQNVQHRHTIDLASALEATANDRGVTILELAVDTSDRLALHAAVTSAIEELAP